VLTYYRQSLQSKFPASKFSIFKPALKVKQNANEPKTVFLLFLAALGFRTALFLLFANELVAGNDQIQNIILARRFAGGDALGFLDSYWTPLYPFLIGVVSLFTDSLVLPSIIISIAAGSLAAPLTFYLVKQSYGRREATIAAVISIVFPHLINSTFSLGTENIYLVWLIGALIICWKALVKNSARSFLLTGVLLGLAYLTRPEAIGYLGFFAAAAVINNLRSRNTFARNSAVQIAALIIGFALLAAPYIVYLKSATGTWTISGKAATNIAAGALQENDSQNLNGSFQIETGKVLTRTIALSLIEIQKSFNYLLPTLLLIFVAVGLFRERWSKERFWRETFLIIFCILTVFCYALTVVQDRYFYILLPVFFGWIARGIVQLELWLRQSMKTWTANKFYYRPTARPFAVLCLIFIYLYVLPVSFFMRTKEKAWQTTAYEERDAGTWLKENGKRSPLIYSISQRPIFYAEGRQLRLTTADSGEILRQIKENKVDYIVANERSVNGNPFLKNFDEMLRNAPEFEQIYEKSEPPGFKISIFRLR
jgi:Dolichyl-phosphate-mannose-protein mannosyltransferase